MPRRKHSTKKVKMTPRTDANQNVRESIARKEKQFEHDRRVMARRIAEMEMRKQAVVAPSVETVAVNVDSDSPTDTANA